MKPLLFFPYDVLGIDPGPEQSGWMLVRATGGGAAHYVDRGVIPSTARDFLARGAFLLTTAVAAPAVARWGTSVPIAATGAFMAVLGAATLVRRRP